MGEVRQNFLDDGPREVLAGEDTIALFRPRGV